MKPKTSHPWTKTGGYKRRDLILAQLRDRYPKQPNEILELQLEEFLYTHKEVSK